MKGVADRAGTQWCPSFSKDYSMLLSCVTHLKSNWWKVDYFLQLWAESTRAGLTFYRWISFPGVKSSHTLFVCHLLKAMWQKPKKPDRLFETLLNSNSKKLSEEIKQSHHISTWEAQICKWNTTAVKSVLRLSEIHINFRPSVMRPSCCWSQKNLLQEIKGVS